jgi:pimeloyl-ACP methyl ester carboxylesterase
MMSVMTVRQDGSGEAGGVPKVAAEALVAAPALEPVVFLPGLLCDSRLWRTQVAGLADLAAPMVADLTLDDSIPAMARRTLAAAPARFSLVGLSMGGYVALEIMRQAPERVRRLALIDTSARIDSPARTAARRAGIESLRRGTFVGITQRILSDLIHPRHVDGPVADELRHMARRVGGEAFLRQQTAIMNRPDSTPSLDAIEVDTLIAVGDGDRVTPVDHAEEMHARIRRSRLHRFQGCGHLPALECPDETTALLRQWLVAELRGGDGRIH